MLRPSLRVVFPNEERDQIFEIIKAFAQRRQKDRHDVQAIKQVFAKIIFFDHFLKIAVGRRDHARVRRDFAIAADGYELSLLQHAEQLHLHIGFEFADLIQKNCTFVRRLEFADLAFNSSGE